jgi:uncharacterized protein YdeI (BOF family)
MSEGDISAVLASHEFNTADGKDVSLIHVSGDIFAIAYRGQLDDGYICTFSIDASGSPISANIDHFEFDTDTGMYPDIIHVSGDVFAIAYRGASNYGTVKTLTIDSSGNIGAAAIDTLVFDSVLVEFPTIIHIFGDIYAIVYKGSLNKGRVVTVDIDISGNIGAAFIDDFYFDGTYCRDPDIVHISGDIYAIAYEGVDSDGFVCTVDIDTSGNIVSACVDTLEFDTGNCYIPSLLLITGNIYAVAYQASSNKCNCATFTIDAAGNIGAATIDSFEFESVDGYSPKMIHVSGEVYAVSYRGVGGDGWTVTFSIDSSGNISASVIDSLEFDTANCNMPDMIHVSGDVYAIAYQGVDDDGWLKTIGIETVIPTAAIHELLMGI